MQVAVDAFHDRLPVFGCLGFPLEGVLVVGRNSRGLSSRGNRPGGWFAFFFLRQAEEFSFACLLAWVFGLGQLDSSLRCSDGATDCLH